MLRTFLSMTPSTCFIASVWASEYWAVMVSWPIDPGADPTSGLEDCTARFPIVAEGICGLGEHENGSASWAIVSETSGIDNAQKSRCSTGHRFTRSRKLRGPSGRTTRRSLNVLPGIDNQITMTSSRLEHVVYKSRTLMIIVGVSLQARYSWMREGLWQWQLQTEPPRSTDNLGTGNITKSPLSSNAATKSETRQKDQFLFCPTMTLLKSENQGLANIMMQYSARVSPAKSLQSKTKGNVFWII